MLVVAAQSDSSEMVSIKKTHPQIAKKNISNECMNPERIYCQLPLALFPSFYRCLNHSFEHLQINILQLVYVQAPHTRFKLT